MSGKVNRGKRGIASKIDGTAVAPWSFAFRFRFGQVEDTTDRGSENHLRGTTQGCDREDMSSCTAKSRTPELRVQRGAQHHKRSADTGSRGHARSCTVFPARIAGSTTQQSLRSVRPAVAAIVFQPNRTRPSHVDATDVRPPKVRLPTNSVSPARNSNSEVIPERFRSRR